METRSPRERLRYCSFVQESDRSHGGAKPRTVFIRRIAQRSDIACKIKPGYIKSGLWALKSNRKTGYNASPIQQNRTIKPLSDFQVLQSGHAALE